MNTDYGNEKLVFELLQLYDIACAKGILAIKERLASSEYDLLKRLGNVMFRCIEEGISIPQLNELFSNYAECDLCSDETEKKLIPAALLCIIAGEKRAYFVELMLSITGMDFEMISDQQNSAEQKKYFVSKKLYSANTNKLEHIEADDKSILRCLNKLENKVLIWALYGASGKTIERFLSMVDPELAGTLLEDLHNVMDSEIDEKLIIEAQLTVLNLLGG